MPGSVSPEERFAIQDLLMAYVYATDTGDAQGYADTFAGDGVLYTSRGETIVGGAAIRDYARKTSTAPGNRGRQHYFQTIRVSREPGGLRVFSFWHVVDMKAEPRMARVRSMGTCDDLCVMTEHGLRFAERRIGPWNDQAAPWVG
jgi:uncharacterized protein (TIGR02246 family)